MQHYSTFIFVVPYISHLGQNDTEQKVMEPVMKLQILISVTKNEIQNHSHGSFLQMLKKNTCAGVISFISLNAACLWKIISVMSTKSCNPGQKICGLLSVLTQFFLTTHSFPPFCWGKINFRKNPAWG